MKKDGYCANMSNVAKVVYSCTLKIKFRDTFIAQHYSYVQHWLYKSESNFSSHLLAMLALP